MDKNILTIQEPPVLPPNKYSPPPGKPGDIPIEEIPTEQPPE